MPFFDAPHATLYYDVFAPDITENAVEVSSHTVLLLHGFAGTPMSDFAAQLPRLTSQYTVVAPHLHGYGRSSHRTSYSISYYREDVADLLALLDALHLETVNVLAFSDGSIVALLLAALHPQRVTALAVLGAQASVDAQDAAALRHWLLEKPLSEAWQQELTRLHGDPYWRSLLPMFVEVQEALVQAGGILVTDEELAAIRCPTLLMHGKRDRIVRAEYATILHEHIAQSHVLLFDAGHAAHLRYEQEFTQTVMRFFASPEHFENNPH
ncbi:MAG: 2-succinyl-6-hydroxy-2,4-cyclohexadiene-1-carboxylate synthase [Ktedonobacteraceae bacterium]